MADRPSRTHRNVQKASHSERTCASKRQAMEHNRADPAREKDGKRESRRSKPEMALYRPGMGLLQKKADQSGTPDAKGQNPVPGLKDLSLKDGVNGKWSGNRAKRPDQPVYTPRQVKPSADRPTALHEGRPKAAVVDSKGPPCSTKPFPMEGTKPATEKNAEVSVEKLQQHPRPESALQNGHQERRAETKATENSVEHPKEISKALEVIGPPALKQQAVVGERYGPGGDTSAPKPVDLRSDRNFARTGRRGRGSGRRSGPFPDTRVQENWDISDGPGTLSKPQQGVPARTPGQPVQTTSPDRRNSFSEGPRHSGSDDADETEHDVRRRGMKKKIKKRRNKPRDDQPVANTAVNGLSVSGHHSDGNATTEEDWSGELIVESSVHPRIYSQEQVSGNNGTKRRERNDSYQSSSPEPCRFGGRKFINRHRRESFSEEEKDKGPTRSRNGPLPAPIIKDWSAAVAEEEERQRHSLSRTVDNVRNDSSDTSSYRSTFMEVHRKNRKNDASSQKASPPKAHESQLPPRFQKRNRPATPENTVSSAAKGGLIRLPCDVSLNGSGPAEHQCDERSVVVAPMCGMGQEKPLIAVKPQPHVPVDSIYSRTMPMALQPGFSHHYEPAPPSVMSPPVVSAAYPTVPGVPFSCHHPSHGLPTVYHGDQVIAPESYGRSRIKPLVEKNLHDAALLERELMNYLSKGIQNIDTKAMGHCRWKLQLRYENVILADPRYCAERNVENALWKSAFYQGIEAFRRIMEECPDFQEEAKMQLLNLVDEGTIFYENLLDKFQETYGFSLSQFLEPDLCASLSASSSSSAGGVAGGRAVPDSVRLVLISVQKIYICLGDLARYREQAMGTTNYGKARSWYLKAQQIAPKNGRPYNQLAILALYARRKLDAVYYYMRSLAASNPFLTARESLLALFDDARKKYDHLERRRLEEEGASQQPSLESPCDEERTEIWIRPDGTTSHWSSRQGDQASREVEQLSQLSTIDLNKRYVLSFLHVHGKLFTKVGMETFSETARRMLMEFRCLLQRTPAAVTNSRHLQLLAINMFTVANTCLKDRNMEPDCRSLLQEQSLQVALAHVAIVMERATQLLQQSSSSPSSSTSSSPGGPSFSSRVSLSDELAELLPTLKLWTDWMSCQKRLWIPPPTPCDYNTSVKGNVWTTLADLLTVLWRLNLGDIKFFKEPAEDRELVTLPEDATLASFVPLLGAPQEAFYVQVPCDRERARNCLRINRIQFFGDYLCGISPPYLEFNVERKRFVSLIAVSDTESDSEKELTYDSSEDELELGDSLDDQEAPLKSGEEESEIQRLWTKKEQLRKAKEQHERQHACVQAVLQEHRSKQAAMLEIRPRFLIPDTNCFIDHLPLVQKLVADGHFNVYVPIVVLNELHGLARGGSRPGPCPDHCEKVGSSARAALTYLEERFGQREPKLRAITIRGSILDTIGFRSEDLGDYKGTNDDQILTCCLLLCSDRTEHALPREPDAPVKLYRETVLITEDRNLCVKALTHNVPVRDLPAFLRWANIS
ncbi:telomerase-binding protein EST1A isoform X2 [Rhipicephalus sanguineus]|uniref:telomerase-binding protein EST1A isoform X2 n=1 Tax=Rhipicephalus sanguineus TaxID=34632 RepID=UPI001896270A|nr:telomerase-binding protein EST1A isoform X2 [Rhipicephalus sanguineus]